MLRVPKKPMSRGPPCWMASSSERYARSAAPPESGLSASAVPLLRCGDTSDWPWVGSVKPPLSWSKPGRLYSAAEASSPARPLARVLRRALCLGLAARALSSALAVEGPAAASTTTGMRDEECGGRN
jgi:hypothetical protein